MNDAKYIGLDTQEEEANRSASHREANRNCTSKQGAGCSQNSSGSRLRQKCFSLDIAFYRTFR